MKEMILETLEYPRRHIRMDLRLDDCVHGGNYNQSDGQCYECESRSECRWMSKNDECVDLKHKSVEHLMGALEFSLEYIDGKLADWGHNIDACECETCGWLRRAEVVYDRCRHI